LAEKKALEVRLQTTELRLRNLEAKLDEDGRESSDMDILHKRLAEELEDEREQHQKDLSERDFTVDQTRKKYQGGSLVLFSISLVIYLRCS
jgi:myosin protein heavy chain